MHIAFSTEVIKVLGLAAEEAQRTGYCAVGPDHIMLGILRHRDNDACRVLEAEGSDLAALKKRIDSRIFRDEMPSIDSLGDMKTTKEASKALNFAAYETLRHGGTRICAIHLLLALSRMDSACCPIGYEKLLSSMNDCGMLHAGEGTPHPQNMVVKAELLAGQIASALRSPSIFPS